MDLLDFEVTELYFQEEDAPEVKCLIQQAAELYESNGAELPLLKAFLRSPESLNVLVALNRYYYYQHRLTDSLLISEKALSIIRVRIDFPEQWQTLTLNHISCAPKEQLTAIRLYLFTLKSIGFLNMRLNNLELSQSIFEKLVMLDHEDRIGAKSLLEIVSFKINENRGIYQIRQA